MYCPNSVLKTRAGWNSGSWRISDAAFDLCLQIDDGIANRLRAANQDIAFSWLVERLRCVGQHRDCSSHRRWRYAATRRRRLHMWIRPDSRVTINCQIGTVVSQPAPSADSHSPLSLSAVVASAVARC